MASKHRILITGAASGIGLALTEHFTAGGHDHWPMAPICRDRRTMSWVRGLRSLSYRPKAEPTSAPS